MKLTAPLVLVLLFLSPRVFGAITYISSNSVAATTSLTNDVLAGIAPTGTATREGGDADTSTIQLGSLTDGVTGTTESGRSFVHPGTLDYDLGGTFDISTIYFRLVNALVDDRLAFGADVYFSSNNGAGYSLVSTILDLRDNASGEFATTGVLSMIEGTSVTNIRFIMSTPGNYRSSFSEIDVVGTAVPEPSQYLLFAGAIVFSAVIRKRRHADTT